MKTKLCFLFALSGAVLAAQTPVSSPAKSADPEVQAILDLARPSAAALSRPPISPIQSPGSTSP